MRNFYSLKVFLTMCFLCVVSVLGAVAQTTVTDELTTTSLGISSGGSYNDRTTDAFGSGAVYMSNAYYATGGNAGAIQLRSKNNTSGIISTKSGGG